jgi:hypothetical protein
VAKTVGIVDRRGGRRARTLDAATVDLDPIRRIHAMPAEVGILLIVSGIGGILLPGPVGTPFLLLGCLMLWPKAFHQTGKCFESRFPKMHYHGVKQINRFLVDLEKRYPPSR